MLEISEPNRASFRKLVPDFAFLTPFTPLARSPPSELFLGLSVFSLTSSTLDLLLLPLLDLLGSGSSAVSGGLGGARVGGAGVDFFRRPSLLPRSVASGVMGSAFVLLASSLPTASLLWALLKVGYELGASPLIERRSISGTAMEAVFLRMLLASLLSEVVGSRSRSVDFRVEEWSGSLVAEEDLCDDREVLSRKSRSSVEWCLRRCLFRSPSWEEDMSVGGGGGGEEVSSAWLARAGSCRSGHLSSGMA